MLRTANGDSRSHHATRARIFDAAEALFIECGFDGTSLRQVTARAKVNLAAVNYHFGGKNGLFTAMIARRFDPLNDGRIALLDEYRREVRRKSPSCERVLAAMFAPALQLARDPGVARVLLELLLGHVRGDPCLTGAGVPFGAKTPTHNENSTL